MLKSQNPSSLLTKQYRLGLRGFSCELSFSSSVLIKQQRDEAAISHIRNSERHSSSLLTTNLSRSEHFVSLHACKISCKLIGKFVFHLNHIVTYPSIFFCIEVISSTLFCTLYCPRSIFYQDVIVIIPYLIAMNI